MLEVNEVSFGARAEEAWQTFEIGMLSRSLLEYWDAYLSLFKAGNYRVMGSIIWEGTAFYDEEKQILVKNPSAILSEGR